MAVPGSCPKVIGVSALGFARNSECPYVLACDAQVTQYGRGRGAYEMRRFWKSARHQFALVALLAIASLQLFPLVTLVRVPHGLRALSQLAASYKETPLASPADLLSLAEADRGIV